MSPTNFSSDLANFLHSVRGARFGRDFRFAGDLDCQQDAPPVLASRFLLSFSLFWDHYFYTKSKRHWTAFPNLRFSIEYRQFGGPEEHVPARRAVEKVLNQSGLSTAFSFVKVIAIFFRTGDNCLFSGTDLRCLGDGRDHWRGIVEERSACDGLRHCRCSPSPCKLQVLLVSQGNSVGHLCQW